MMDPEIAVKMAMESNLEAKDMSVSDKKKLAQLKKKASKNVGQDDKYTESSR